MWKLAAAFALSAGLVFTAAGQASAATPVIGTFPIDDHFVDEGASAACGFPVSVDLTGTGRFMVFVDAQGNPTQVQVHEDATGTMSANGISLQEVDHNIQFFDLAAGTQTEVGIVFREFLPGPGCCHHGPRPGCPPSMERSPSRPALIRRWTENLAALCAALTP